MPEIQNTAAESIQNLKTEIQNQADVRIILWDIDGTLLQSTRMGGFKEYFAKALKKVYGTQGKILDVNAAGITDVQIVYQALRDEGFTVEKIVAELDEFMKAVCDEMRKYIAENEKVYEILPGVKEILQATDEHPRFLNALLTGNIGCGAQMKMRGIGVWDYFKNSPNAFGEISHERRDLAIKAGEMFNARYDFDFKPAQFIVIGDTPQDIAAAKHFGAKIVCVETGRGIEREDLAAQNPDGLIENLGDTNKVLELLESL